MTIFEATSRLAVTCGKLFHLLSRYSYIPLRVSGLAIGLLLCWSGPAAADLSLTSDTDTATAGYFQLNWQADRAVSEYHLEESREVNFADARTIYRGADLATVISGKSDGLYYYRVSDAANPASHSETVVVQVNHHPLFVAFSFFAMGAFVFLATLAVVLSGRRQTG